MDINSIPLVSLDFKGNPHSYVYDKQHTQKIGSSTKILLGMITNGALLTE